MLQLDTQEAVRHYKQSKRRLLVLGYNATLTTAVEAPRQPKRHFDQIKVLSRLQNASVSASVIFSTEMNTSLHLPIHAMHGCCAGCLLLYDFSDLVHVDLTQHVCISPLISVHGKLIKQYDMTVSWDVLSMTLTAEWLGSIRQEQRPDTASLTCRH